MNKLLSGTSLMKILIGSLIGAAVTVLVQVWFAVFSGAVFYKLLISFGIIVALCGVLLAAASDFQEERKDQKDSFFN